MNATSRPVYIMFLDGRGRGKIGCLCPPICSCEPGCLAGHTVLSRGPYDNRLRMLTKNEAIYPEEALAFGTCPPGVACILPLVVAGVGGLGLHGCEYVSWRFFSLKICRRSTCDPKLLRTLQVRHTPAHFPCSARSDFGFPRTRDKRTWSFCGVKL